MTPWNNIIYINPFYVYCLTIKFFCFSSLFNNGTNELKNLVDESPELILTGIHINKYSLVLLLIDMYNFHFCLPH